MLFHKCEKNIINKYSTFYIGLISAMHISVHLYMQQILEVTIDF